MVARTAAERQSLPQNLPPDWRRQLRASAISPDQLLQRLKLPARLLDEINTGHRLFALRVPEAFIRKMRIADPADPLLRQVLPLSAEALPAPDFIDDPVGDLSSRAAPGILHKYHGRVLLLVTGACAVNCRYCFRRNFPYSEQQLKPADWQHSLAYLRRNTDISEVIFSGGDPLLLSTARLAALTRDLSNIAHLRRLRIHTRLPVMIPDRVTPQLCAWLAELPWPVCMVLHINHPAEIDASLQQACRRLQDVGVNLLNQSVLLQGVNDNAEIQTVLSEKLYSVGVLQYYLHQLDPVTGARHFAVADQRALEIHRQMRAKLPGYLLPRLVREIPGKAAKTPLSEAMD